MGDMERQESGHLAAYRYDEIPAKFQDMLDLYKTWRIYFATQAHKRDTPPDALAEIEAFRRREGKR